MADVMDVDNSNLRGMKRKADEISLVLQPPKRIKVLLNSRYNMTQG